MPITTFADLEVYRNSYKAAILVLTRIIPKLPKEEKYVLGDQMRRACKAIPALIAEGYAKKHHKRQWRKYIDDGIGECNEMIVHLSFARDLGHPEQKLLEELIDTYDKSGKQLYNLGKSWEVRKRE